VPELPYSMNFNTAVFYDIENLLKGYSFTQETVANLSLTEIVASIKTAKSVGRIATQRAYANWSDPRLAIMRGEINELGIEPIQVFGFGREPKKNSADIQLAIDAVDLAHSRSSLQVFVIVSGDGGFAALAKKLHEYGKAVVGCSYRTSASRVFQAVCDEFLTIADPTPEERCDNKSAVQATPRPPGLTDPRNQRLATEIQPLQPPFTTDAMIAKAAEVLSWYAKDHISLAELNGNGMVLSVVQEAFQSMIPGLNTIRLGFPKFVEFLQFLTSDKPLCIVRRFDSQPVLVLRKRAESIGEILPRLQPREVHSPEVYRLILGSGPPLFRLPGVSDIVVIIAWLISHRPEDKSLGVLIEEAASDLQSQVSSDHIKQVMLALVSAGAFLRRPEGSPIADQTLTLPPELSTEESVLRVLRQAAASKLEGVLGRAEEEVLNQLLPPVP